MNKCLYGYCYIFFLDIEKSLKIYEASKIYNSINRAKIINFIPCKNPFPSFNCSSTCISHFFLLPCTYSLFFALSMFSFLFLIILLMKVCTTCKSLLSFRFVVFLAVIIVNLFFLSYPHALQLTGLEKSHSRIS